MKPVPKPIQINTLIRLYIDNCVQYRNDKGGIIMHLLMQHRNQMNFCNLEEKLIVKQYVTRLEQVAYNVLA